MANDASTKDFPDTPAGRQATWFFHQSNSQGRDLTVEEIVEHMCFEPPWKPENSLERFRSSRGEAPVVEMDSKSPYEFEVWTQDDNGRRWHATFRVEEAAPHRITFMEWRADLGDGVVIREATPEDSAALAAVERDSPVIFGDVSMTYDRDDDFLSFTRLMEEDVCYVADQGGTIIGMYGCASHFVRSGGQDHRVMLFHHLRVPTTTQKKGVFSALNMRMFDHYADRYGPWWKGSWFPYAYIGLANAAAMRLGGPGSWSFGPLRALLDCASLAGEPYGKVAEPSDAPEIVRIINACHEEETLFLPYTVDFLTARLERAPDLYTWTNLLVGDGTVLGVWPSGLRVTTTGDGEPRDSVRASVLDHGFLPGAEDEFERLLRSWCRKALELGSTELSFITSEGSPGYQLIERLAFRMDAFDYKQGLPEPEGAKDKGLYVDPIYF